MQLTAIMQHWFEGNLFDKGQQKWWLLSLSILFCFEYVSCSGGYSQDVFTRAIVNITYKDPVTGQIRSEREEIGRYGTVSKIESEYGLVVHIRTQDNQTHGCTPPVNVPKERWIALIERGDCKFQVKIHNAAIKKNASAVVVYNNKEEDLLTMEHQVENVVSIFIAKDKGQRIARLVDNGTRVTMHITVGKHESKYHGNINKTSVLFVSISFIVLMIISLAWLVFYYIQRFRYAHAKERLSKRLMNAAKKAIAKMPMRTVKNGDRETDSDFDQCAVCIEGYKASEVIRILPCRHMFHKSCVDPWLMEQRSCPMCKMDILKAYGLQIHGSRESMCNMEAEAPSTSIGPSEHVHIGSSSLDDSAATAPGVEIIHYQPPQVEYHETPVALVAAAATPVDEAATPQETEPMTKVAAASSMESVRSQESESNELQSLMPQRKESVSEHEDITLT